MRNRPASSPHDRGVIYGDFNTPLCLLASAWLDHRAGAAGDIEWRAVEHRPGLPVHGYRPEPAEAAAWHDELSIARAALPGGELPAHPPAFVVNTAAAVAGYAEASVAGVGDTVRALLFGAYWCHGTDIGDPEVLRGLLAGPIRSGHPLADPVVRWGYAVTRLRAPVTTPAWRLTGRWHEQWRHLGAAELPVLVSGGDLRTGAAAVKALAQQIGGDAPGARAATDAAEHPSGQPGAARREGALR